jgi:hypothetical protein
VAGEGFRRRPAAVAAAARGRAAGRRNVSKQASAGASPEPKEATRAAGRRRARAGEACTERRRPWRRVARVARGGGTGGLIYVAPRDQILAVLQRLRASAYGGGTADGTPVRGVRARTAALTPGRLRTGCAGGAGPRDGARLGRRGLGRRRRGRRC